ncbi:p53-induced death domain-containing protein 1 isoform X2 [Brienomyrus brachyistius]|uniref:p53-induced death domain-containing protein 1 isoform X2 n=1 Tax=Brienomyrus brachyistius TaxID=42636 RepID=UPI0020B30E25|nr:p53-induced death domain-containing protein 1 isoform X2 [Brienomyrus brachyistius]
MEKESEWMMCQKEDVAETDSICSLLRRLQMQQMVKCQEEHTRQQQGRRRPQCKETEVEASQLEEDTKHSENDGREADGENRADDKRRNEEEDDESVSSSSSDVPSLDTCTPTKSVESSSSSSNLLYSHITSSCPPLPYLCPPVPPPVELDVVLVDSRLTLDVYRGGTALLKTLWENFPGKVKEVQYLRIGSEESESLETVLDLLPHLRLLRSLAIRGHCLQDSLGHPLPGVLSSLPPSLSSLTLLTHLDLSFNCFTSLPPCLLSLPCLSILILSHNHLSSLPSNWGCLSSLTYLSVMGNQLCSLPASLAQLGALHTLDVSHNFLENLPEEIGELRCLNKMELSHNRLRELPETLQTLVNLRELMANSNHLRCVPEFLTKLPHLKTLDAKAGPSELHLGASQHRFSVTPAGHHVFLPRGVELLFPEGCVGHSTELEWAETRPDKKWICLEEHDHLLSWPLELLPHGIIFQKPVQVCMPYQQKTRREIVVRRFDGSSWSTLQTWTRRGSPSNSARPGGRRARLACCTVSHFSWFVVVSCPVRDTCSVSPEGALLVSSVNPAIKLRFLPSSTTQTRTVTLQVLQVEVSVVRELSSDPTASASPLLCLSQSPSLPYLQPVTVQVPLPPGLTGHTVDMSCLYLLHRQPDCQTWTDVTPQTPLRVTQLYVVFSVSHFSWYWLWYTTQRCVSGVVRKVYQRLRQFRVQFLVLQRKSDPEQVLLQCLPHNKVENTIQYLSSLYEGPQPSDFCELLEGEQFFAGFEKGIDISTERPDCINGRLSFIFYSHLKNHKEVYICSNQKQQGPVKGQVSFYRGEMPSDVPQEVAQKRRGPNSQWLATLPLRLPGAGGISEPQIPPLRLGDPENGYLTEANLLAISLQISQDWRSIGINLGFSYEELNRMQHKHRDDLGVLVLDILFHWARRRGHTGPGAVPELIDAMTKSGRQDLADEIEDIVSLGKRKYRDSLRRVGLDTEGLLAE